MTKATLTKESLQLGEGRGLLRDLQGQFTNIIVENIRPVLDQQLKVTDLEAAGRDKDSSRPAVVF